jgi:micrococcal nuclease
MKKGLIQIVLLVVGIIVFIFANGFGPQDNQYTDSTQDVEGVTTNQYTVTRVIDGDTIEVNIEGQPTKVRLIGINTPETVDPRKEVECYGKEASARLKELIEGKKVTLEADSTQQNTDKYGRLLRYVFLDKKNIDLQMVEEGYAFEYTYFMPYKYQAEFKTAEKNAQDNNLGLWNPNVCQYERK